MVKTAETTNKQTKSHHFALKNMLAHLKNCPKCCMKYSVGNNNVAVVSHDHCLIIE